MHGLDKSYCFGLQKSAESQQKFLVLWCFKYSQSNWLVNMILAAKYIASFIYYCLLIDREHCHHFLITFSYCIRCDGKKHQKNWEMQLISPSCFTSKKLCTFFEFAIFTKQLFSVTSIRLKSRCHFS